MLRRRRVRLQLAASPMSLNEIAPPESAENNNNVGPIPNAARIRHAATALWQWLRGFTGDTAYEGYLRHAAERSGKRLTAEEFYLDDIERKFTRPNRCC